MAVAVGFANRDKMMQEKQVNFSQRCALNTKHMTTVKLCISIANPTSIMFPLCSGVRELLGN